MSNRFGEKSRGTQPITGFSQRAAAGSSSVEIVASFSPAPAAPTSPVTIDGIEYIVATVTANTTLTTTAPPTAVANIVIVAGGGSGGSGPGGGGGGGGGFIDRAVKISTGSYPLVVGGAGSNSTGFTLTATAGGSGGNASNAGSPGGSGGGAGGGPTPLTGGAGTSTPFFQGNPGADGNSTYSNGNGGGGAGGAGQAYIASPTGFTIPASGGEGRVHNLPGSPVTLGAGGAGGPFSGGGAGAAGTVNTGNGGGGGSTTQRPNPFGGPYANPGGAGGSGVLYVRWQRFQA